MAAFFSFSVAHKIMMCLTSDVLGSTKYGMMTMVTVHLDCIFSAMAPSVGVEVWGAPVSCSMWKQAWRPQVAGEGWSLGSPGAGVALRGNEHKVTGRGCDRLAESLAGGSGARWARGEPSVPYSVQWGKYAAAQACRENQTICVWFVAKARSVGPLVITPCLQKLIVWEKSCLVCLGLRAGVAEGSLG